MEAARSSETLVSVKTRNLAEGDSFGDLGVDGRIIILKWIINTECEDLDWIELAQNRVQWRAVV
jgi:hypothetical protein